MVVVNSRDNRGFPAGALVGVLLAGFVVSGCTAAAPSVATAPASAVTPATSNREVTASPSPSPTKARPTTTASSASQAPALKIRSVTNFRDVAGTGLALTGGGEMATGVVYRSAKLATLSSADSLRLQKVGLLRVIDLRTTVTAGRSPDPTIKGVEHDLVNIYGTPNSPPLRSRTVAGAKAYMQSLNVGFVADPDQRARIAKVLTLVASTDGPVLVHCTEGKDRTGWVSAILQLTAGADPDDVMTEYLKSNEYRASIIDSTYRTTLARQGLTAARAAQAMVKVDQSYLAAGLEELKQRYGDVDGYLTDGLGLSKATIAKLRARLTA